MSNYGTFTMLCAHKEYHPYGHGPMCGQPATHHEFGMDRCDEHQSDLDPSTWPKLENKNERDTSHQS